MTGLLSLVFEPFLDKAPHPTSAWLRLAVCAAALALLASIAGNALWNRMSRLLPLTLVGPMILFETLFALLYGFVWEHRLPTSFEAMAFFFLSAGVLTSVAVHKNQHWPSQRRELGVPC
jgi:drug/metabolite transporter (DMT)-like permease